MSDTRNGTLAAGAVTTETLDADYDYVDVLCVGSSAIYFRLDGVAPVVGADGCYVVAPNGSLRVPVEGGGETVVKLISAGTPDYSVSPDPGLERSGAGLATTSVAGNVEVANDVGNPLPVKQSAGADHAVRTTNGAVTAVAGRLFGFAVRNTSASAPATVYLRDGDDAGDGIVVPIELAPGQSRDGWYGDKGIAIAVGIFVDIASGAAQVSVFSGAA